MCPEHISDSYAGVVPAATPTLPDPTPTQVLNALSECVVDLADLQDPHLVRQAIVRRTRALLGTDMAYLSLNDLARGETHIEVTDGVRTEAYRTISMPLGTGVLGAVAAGGTEVQTFDYLRDPAMNHLPHIDEIVRGEGVCAIHGCPVRAGGRVVAALLVAHRTPIRFSRRQIAALRRMAEHAAIALEPVHAGSDDRLLLFSDELVARIPDGPQALCDLLGERLGQSVELHGVEVAVAGADPAVLRTAVTTSLHTGQPVALPVALPDTGSGSASSAVGATVTVLAIRRRDEQLATVLVPADPMALGERGQLLMARAATAIGAALVGQQRLADVELRSGSDVVGALLQTDRPTADLLSRLEALGLARRRPVTVLVVAAGERSRVAVAALVRRAAGPAAAVLSGSGEEHVVVAQVADPAGLAERLQTILVEHTAALLDDEALLGWSVTDRGLAGTATAYRLAQRTVLALRALGVRQAWADASSLGPAALLVAGADQGLVSATIDAQLEPLLDGDLGGRLTETAWVVLETGGRLREAAARLHIHPNTVRQRCERISALLGEQWRVAPASLDVHFALRLWRVRAALSAAD